VADRLSKGFGENSDVDTAKEFTRSISIENGVKADVKAIQTQDDMLGTIIDIMA
jgi:flagellar hook protein FlgE